MKKKLLLFCMLLAFMSSAYAANITWSGVTSNDWNDGTNWIGGTKPGASDYAIIGVGAVVNVSTTETIQGVRVNGGTLTVMAAGVLNCTQGTSSPGVWHSAGTVVNNGTISIAMVTNQCGLQLQGTFTNNGTMNISDIDRQGINVISGSFTNTGNLNIDDTSVAATGVGLNLGGDFTNSGNIQIGGTAALAGQGIVISAGVTLTNSGNIYIDNTGATKHGINNLGTVDNTLTGVINIGVNTLVGGRGISNSGTFTNSGDIVIDKITDEGIFANFGSTFTSSGSMKINGGGTASMWVFNSAGGTLTNTGTLLATEDIVGSNFVNDGIISPGQSPGRLAFRTIYNSGPSAKYLAEIEGTTIDVQYDHLHFYNGGAANFDISSTILEVQLLSGFVPAIGSSFDVLTSQFGFSNQFLSPVLPALPADRMWMLDYTTDPNKLTLKVVAVLPVTLTYFNAQQKGEEVSLNWQTATEINNTGFEIQRSTDGKNWGELSFVEGMGTSYESANYTFMDNSPVKGSNYYRLKQIDYDGGSEFSNIEMVDLGRDTEINIFPNPSNGIFFIDNTTIGKETTATIFSTDGKEMMQVELEGNRIDLSTLTSGTYYIEIGTVSKQVVIK